MTPRFDAHIHIWQSQWENYIVGTGRGGQMDQLQLLLALMDKHGIQRACVLGAVDDKHSDNNEFVAQLCRDHGNRFVW